MNIMWIDEEDYFSDLPVVTHCSVCGEELYIGDDCYFNNNTNSYYCSTDCVKADLDVEVRDEEKHPALKCTHCGKIIKKNDEVTICDGEVFCDVYCVEDYYDIERVDL